MTAQALIREAPRLMSDQELRDHFGLSERKLRAARSMPGFPRRDPVFKKTDRKAVEIWFDRRAGIGTLPVGHGNPVVVDGKEHLR